MAVRAEKERKCHVILGANTVIPIRDSGSTPVHNYNKNVYVHCYCYYRLISYGRERVLQRDNSDFCTVVLCGNGH